MRVLDKQENDLLIKLKEEQMVAIEKFRSGFLQMKDKDEMLRLGMLARDVIKPGMIAGTMLLEQTLEVVNMIASGELKLVKKQARLVE